MSFRFSDRFQHRPLSALLAAMALILVFAACSEKTSLNSQAKIASLSALPVSEMAKPIVVFDAGVATRVLGCSGICDVAYTLWVDAAVRNDSPAKKVFVLWSKDSWQTTERAELNLKETMSDGLEKWGNDIYIGHSWEGSIQAEYRLFVEMNGTTYEDKHGVYVVQGGVTQKKPVRLLSSRVYFAPNSGAILDGEIRAFDFVYNKAVEVVYTTDLWKTKKTAKAIWSRENIWHFETPISDTTTLPERVDFAVHYRTNGAEYWDNNYNQNFYFFVRPTGNITLPPGDESTQFPISGVLESYCSVSSALGSPTYAVRVDTNSWDDKNFFRTSTIGLANGKHRIECRATFPGGYIETLTREFTVRNRIQPLGSAEVPLIPAHDEYDSQEEFGWDATSDRQGRIYLIGGRGSLARYNSFPKSGDLPELFETSELEGRNRLSAVAVADDGQVFALSSELPGVQVYNPSGRINRGVGDNGFISLAGDFDGATFCYAADIAASDKALFVVDSCNGRVLRFGRDGTFERTLKLPPLNNDGWISEFINGVRVSGSRLLVLTNKRLLTLGNSDDSSNLVELFPLSNVFPFNNVEDVVFAQGKYWILNTSPQALVAVSDKGEVESVWYGGSHATASQPGSFDIAGGIAVLADGSLAISSVQSPLLARFSSLLLP